MFAYNFNLRRYAMVPHFCNLVHPKLLYQLNLTGQAALIEAGGVLRTSPRPTLNLLLLLRAPV